MTKAEEFLWAHLHINKWNIKFRRQHPIWQYIVDFYCHKLKLVIEVDGSIHELSDVQQNDILRENHLKEFGLTVLRFTNSAVINNIEDVLKTISGRISELNTAVEARPSPSGAGGVHSPLFVIKIGGNIIDSDAALQQFLHTLASVKGNKILIHGGGKIATKIGEQLGIVSKYINGRRITDDATIDLVTMVYGGLVNKKIVAGLQALQCNAIGLTGADGNLIPATKRPVKDIDYGWAGDVRHNGINASLLQTLLENNLLPVLAPLTHDEQGHILNTNADTIASSVAVALSPFYQVRLIYCFEKKGVLEDVNNDDSVITHINKEKYTQLLNENKLFEGIIPKIDNAFNAIEAGVSQVLIGHAGDLIQNTTNNNIGTLIY